MVEVGTLLSWILKPAFMILTAVFMMYGVAFLVLGALLKPFSESQLNKDEPEVKEVVNYVAIGSLVFGSFFIVVPLAGCVVGWRFEKRLPLAVYFLVWAVLFISYVPFEAQVAAKIRGFVGEGEDFKLPRQMKLLENKGYSVIIFFLGYLVVIGGMTYMAHVAYLAHKQLQEIVGDEDKSGGELGTEQEVTEVGKETGSEVSFVSTLTASLSSIVQASIDAANKKESQIDSQNTQENASETPSAEQVGSINRKESML